MAVTLDTFKRELLAFLRSKPSILSAFGDRPDVYYLRADQAVLASGRTYAVWRLWAEGHHHMLGVSAIESPRLVFEVYDSSEGDAGAGALALDEALDGFRGLWGPVNIRTIQRQSWQALGAPRAAGTDETVANERLDYAVWFART